MYQRVVVAIDGSELSSVALHEGGELARLCQADVYLLAVSNSAFVGSAPAESVPLYIRLSDKRPLDLALKRSANYLDQLGIQVTTSLREGVPATEIAAFAGEIGADLVVIGHSDKSVLARWFEGSVGTSLLRDLSCTLVVATGQDCAAQKLHGSRKESFNRSIPMTDGDKAFYKRRAREERVQAARESDPCLRRLHMEWAALYEARLERVSAPTRNARTAPCPISRQA